MTFTDKYGFTWGKQLSEKIFEESPIGLAFVSINDGKFLRVNKALSKMLEYNEWELLNKTFADITSGADLQADIKAYEELKAGKYSEYSMRKSYITKGRKVIEIMLYVHTIFDDANNIMFFLSSIIPCEIIIDNKSEIKSYSKSNIYTSENGIIANLKSNIVQILVILGTIAGIIYQYGKSQESMNQRMLYIEREIKAVVARNDESLNELKELLKIIND
jgi:PAS domain S-box-containing protein